MHSDRRKWFQQVGLGVAGLSLTYFKTFGLPTSMLLTPVPTVQFV